MGIGLVDSMSRPTGNVTGVSQLNVEVGPKRLEIGRELLPAKSDIALLVNPDNPQHEAILEDAKKEAANLGLRLHILHATTTEEIERAFAMPSSGGDCTPPSV